MVFRTCDHHHATAAAAAAAHCDPLRMLSRHGLEILSWFGGQLQQMQDELLDEDILQSLEGASDAARYQILAELFGIDSRTNTPKEKKQQHQQQQQQQHHYPHHHYQQQQRKETSEPGCPSNANTAASADEATEKKSLNEPTEKAASGYSETGSCRGNASSMQGDSLGILGWFQEHLSKLESDLLNHEPSTSNTSPEVIQARVAEKLRRCERQSERKWSPNFDRPIKGQRGMEREDNQDQDAREDIIRSDKHAGAAKPVAGSTARRGNERTPQDEQKESLELPGTDGGSAPNKAETRATTVVDPNNGGCSSMRSAAKARHDAGFLTPKLDEDDDDDNWTMMMPYRVENKDSVEWHLRGDAWASPDDIEVHVMDQTVSVVASRSEAGCSRSSSRQDVMKAASPNDFVLSRQVQRTLTLPETVDASKITAKFIPHSNVLVLCAPRISRDVINSDNLIPVKIVRTNKVPTPD